MTRDTCNRKNHDETPFDDKEQDVIFENIVVMLGGRNGAKMPHRTRPMTTLLVFTVLNPMLVSTITPVYDFVYFLLFWERRVWQIRTRPRILAIQCAKGYRLLQPTYRFGSSPDSPYVPLEVFLLNGDLAVRGKIAMDH
ncbi:hypothetical protein J1N35_040671 [Gossypium stocksii]|uniref:Uncharacterized protein n=1 Tax=Gossypium stocksii TaxID=47602 RepID=A0A9D3UEJ1_9ROSI|nr:hypothetical protein J1N35_040671 [Gossypium stocksii]